MKELADLGRLACTVCDTELGAQLRAGIFDDRFWPTFAAVVAPFPILLAAAVLVPAVISVHPASKKPNQPEDGNE